MPSTATRCIASNQLTNFHFQLLKLIEQFQPTTLSEILAEFDRPVGCEVEDIDCALGVLVNAGLVRCEKGVFVAHNRLRTIDEEWQW